MIYVRKQNHMQYSEENKIQYSIHQDNHKLVIPNNPHAHPPTRNNSNLPPHNPPF